MVAAAHRGAHVCVRCLRWTRPSGLAQLGLSECSAVAGAAAELWQAAHCEGHDPMVGLVSGDQAPVVMCVRCGCCTEANRVGLGSTCSGRIARGGPVYRRRRFLSGLHPRREVHLDGPYRRPPFAWSLDGDPEGWAVLLGSGFGEAAAPQTLGLSPGRRAALTTKIDDFRSGADFVNPTIPSASSQKNDLSVK